MGELDRINRHHHATRRAPYPCLYCFSFIICWAACWGVVHSFRATSPPPRVMRKSMAAAARDIHWDETSSVGKPAYSPIPVMPSQLFQELAHSQLELLAAALTTSSADGQSKIRSMGLYLPQENVKTGQLEFLPAVLYPHPSSERVFIASDADSGVPPKLPRTLTKLPGFAHAQSLLPGYPMVFSSGNDDDVRVGLVEEVLCDLRSRATALSVPLFSGPQTVGVLLVSPAEGRPKGDDSAEIWTESDRQQVARAAKSLSLALSMDNERMVLESQNNYVKEALSDGLHQLKNPIQALRTYGKLLQRHIADAENQGGACAIPQLRQLADHLMVQSDRVVERLGPVDSIVDSMSTSPKRLPSLNPASDKASLVRWKPPMLPLGTGASTSNLNTKHQPAKMAASSKAEQSPTGISVWLKAEELEMEMTFLDEVLEPIINAFRAISLDRSISFDVHLSDSLPGVMANPSAVQEIVSNLLDNAFKYVTFVRPSLDVRNPAPRVIIDLVPNMAPKAPGVTVLVRDNGPGISIRDREKVFERGYRSPVTEQISGSGLGLGIARSMSERMGGTLTVVDDGGPGTVMELVLFRKPKN